MSTHGSRKSRKIKSKHKKGTAKAYLNASFAKKHIPWQAKERIAFLATGVFESDEAKRIKRDFRKMRLGNYLRLVVSEREDQKTVIKLASRKTEEFLLTTSLPDFFAKWRDQFAYSTFEV